MKEVVTIDDIIYRYDIKQYEKTAIICSDGIIYVNTISAPIKQLFASCKESFDRLINFQTHTMEEIEKGVVKGG